MDSFTKPFEATIVVPCSGSSFKETHCRIGKSSLKFFSPIVNKFNFKTSLVIYQKTLFLLLIFSESLRQRRRLDRRIRFRNRKMEKSSSSFEAVEVWRTKYSDFRYSVPQLHSMIINKVTKC